MFGYVKNVNVIQSERLRIHFLKFEK